MDIFDTVPPGAETTVPVSIGSHGGASDSNSWSNFQCEKGTIDHHHFDHILIHAYRFWCKLVVGSVASNFWPKELTTGVGPWYASNISMRTLNLKWQSLGLTFLFPLLTFYLWFWFGKIIGRIGWHHFVQRVRLRNGRSNLRQLLLHCWGLCRSFSSVVGRLSVFAKCPAVWRCSELFWVATWTNIPFLVVFKILLTWFQTVPSIVVVSMKVTEIDVQHNRAPLKIYRAHTPFVAALRDCLGIIPSVSGTSTALGCLGPLSSDVGGPTRYWQIPQEISNINFSEFVDSMF